VARDVLVRLDAFWERMELYGTNFQSLLKGQSALAKQQDLLAKTFEAQSSGAAYERAGWAEALSRISTALINLEANAEFVIHELRSVRLEQARQGQEIERLKDAFVQLRSADANQQKSIAALTARLDTLSAVISAEIEARNGNGDH
jgi:3-methyladenine DNA glycosylase/8-oxoguanine DNA glycosylase